VDEWGAYVASLLFGTKAIDEREANKPVKKD
jgi:hypothetical protein